MLKMAQRGVKVKTFAVNIFYNISYDWCHQNMAFSQIYCLLKWDLFYITFLRFTLPHY